MRENIAVVAGWVWVVTVAVVKADAPPFVQTNQAPTTASLGGLLCYLQTRAALFFT